MHRVKLIHLLSHVVLLNFFINPGISVKAAFTIMNHFVHLIPNNDFFKAGSIASI
jgi:hypothetical protein